MLYTEWDWDQALAISKEEGFEDGITRGMAVGRSEEKANNIRALKNLLPPETIAEALHVTKEYVMDVLQEPMCVGEPQATYEVKKDKEEE